MEKPLLYEEIYCGMIVADENGDEGVVMECEDPHNVFVIYNEGGQGLFCMQNGCDDFGNGKLFDVEGANY